MMTLPNHTRNQEVAAKLSGLKDLGLGAQTEAHTSFAVALASLDVAESLQLLQLQLAESAKESNRVLHETTAKLIASNEKLATSNDKHATAMQWLTGALVLVGVVQGFMTWVGH